MTKRIVSVWLPRFETDLIARREPRWRTEPLALYRETGQRLETVAVNAAAEAEGVRPGMTLADARALVAGIATRRHAPERRAQALKALTRHLDRFAPLVAIDGDDGFFLETTGTERLLPNQLPGFSPELRQPPHPASVRLVTSSTVKVVFILPGLFALVVLKLPTSGYRIARRLKSRLPGLDSRRGAE